MGGEVGSGLFEDLAEQAAPERAGSGLIAGVSVDNVGSDMGKMRPMSDQLARDYGVRPAEHLVDGGFAKLGDVANLAEAGVTVYASVPEPRDKTRERYAPRPDDPPGVADWRVRMGSPAAKEIYKQRAATAECTNAQARRVRNPIRVPIWGQRSFANRHTKAGHMTAIDQTAQKSC